MCLWELRLLTKAVEAVLPFSEWTQLGLITTFNGHAFTEHHFVPVAGPTQDAMQPSRGVKKWWVKH